MHQRRNVINLISMIELTIIRKTNQSSQLTLSEFRVIKRREEMEIYHACKHAYTSLLINIFLAEISSLSLIMVEGSWRASP
jgi:hypothetical protein